MDALFFIELPEQGLFDVNTKLHWYKKNTQTNLVSSGYEPLNTLQQYAKESQCIGILAATLSYETQSPLNIKSRKQREQALAYDLEEQLSEDVELLHIAYQKNAEKTLDINVIKKSLLKQLLDTLSTADIELQALISETQLLNQFTPDWLILHHETQLLLKTPTTSYAAETENLGVLFELLAEKESLPKTIDVYSNTPSLTFDNLPLTLNTKPIDTPLFNQLCEHYQPSLLNILQGEFQAHTQKTWRTIQLTAIVSFLLIGSLTAFQLYQNQQLNKQSDHLEQQSIALYKDSFPKAKRIINPLSQMRSGLKSLQKNQTKRDGFFPLLAALSRATQQHNDINLSHFQFHKQALLISLSTLSLEKLELFKHSLMQQNINAEISSATKADNRVLAQLKITGITR